MQLNASRIKVLQAQDDIVNSMKESASKQLLRVSNNKKEYKKLLKDLIVQVIRLSPRIDVLRGMILLYETLLSTDLILLFNVICRV